MTVTSAAKVVQYLGEAHSAEQAWHQMLSQHIAMTPAGSYRNVLERQRTQSERHADRLRTRLRDLGQRRSVLGVAGAGVNALTGLVGQALSVSVAPLHVLRSGVSGEEKMLANAEDQASVLQRLHITYLALEHLADAVDDDATAELASSIGDDKHQGLGDITGAVKGLVDAVVRSQIQGKQVYDPATTGAAQTARRLARQAKDTAEEVGDQARTQARQARKIPGVAQIEGEVKGALASEGDLPIADYDELTAAEINAKLSSLSQIDLAKIDAYERKNANRSTVTDRISTLRGDEPWAGYDEQTVVEIRKALTAGDERLARAVNAYERRHKDRQGAHRHRNHRLWLIAPLDSRGSTPPPRERRVTSPSDRERIAQSTAAPPHRHATP